MKIKDKTKIIILTILLVILVFALSITFILLLKETKDNVNDNNTTTNIIQNNLYGIVVEVGENYIKLKSTDNNSTYIIKTTDNIYEIGDLVNVIYEEDDAIIDANRIDIVAKNTIIDEIKDEETTINTTSKITTTASITTTNQVNNNTTTSATITDDDIVNVVKEEYENIDKVSLKENTKDKFITLVDFIFYGGTIKGKTFNELSTSAKAKVIYYTLLIDSKIDSKFPDYKDTLTDTYKDVKAKLLLKYIDLTTSICENEPTGTLCSNLKYDLNLLKSSLSLTWDVIKPGLNYIKELGLTGISKLKSWYETFRDA